MKKLLSILLALTLVLSLGTTAFAEDTTLTFTDDGSGREYVGYQLLKLETLGLTAEEAEDTILKGFLA